MIFANNNKAGKSVKYVRLLRRIQRIFLLQMTEIIKLSKYAQIIEEHYKVPMDIEWAKDGKKW
jgi:pyruvate,water dikinase